MANASLRRKTIQCVYNSAFLSARKRLGGTCITFQLLLRQTKKIKQVKGKTERVARSCVQNSEAEGLKPKSLVNKRLNYFRT